jgi:hypothetical protein
MAQAFTNLSGNQGGNANEPTSYTASDGFVGAPVSPLNPNNPTFNSATFPAGIAAGQTIHGASVSATLSLPVTAVTNTDLTLSLPTGARITSMLVYTTTAYTGNTGNVTLQIGSAAAGAQYVAATRIDAIGVVTLTPVNAQAAALLSLPAGTPNFFIRIVQAASSTAVGAGTLVVNYTVP